LHDELDLMEKELNANFQHYWTPFEYNAIDEIMRKFKGHWKKGKVYSPDKPCKWGLKYYAMVDCAQFLFWFRLYKRFGKEERAQMTEEELAMHEGSVTRNLCNDAMNKLPTNMGQYKIYADNFYGGMELAVDTLARGFGFTFCCKANRPGWLFKGVLDTELATHSTTGLSDFACRVNQTNGMAAISWKDKAQVRYLTNQHANSSAQVERKSHMSEEKRMETIPTAAMDYTKKGMGHVDTFDHHMINCGFKHKNSCWRRTHFLTMLKMTIVNSWRFYKVQHVMMKKGKVVEMSQKSYLLLLQNEIMQEWKKDMEGEQLAYQLKRRAKQRDLMATKRAKLAHTAEGIPKTMVHNFKATSRATLLQQYMEKINT
jgi:hypothetical protein